MTLLLSKNPIGIFAPAGKIEEEKFQQGLKIIKSWGIRTKLSSNIYKALDYWAGSEEERFQGLWDLINIHKCPFLWAARGGYGCLKLLPIMEKAFSKKNIPPLLLIGFSDVSILLNYFYNRFSIFSLHAPVVSYLPFTDNKALFFLRDLLLGYKNQIKIAGETWQKGEAQAVLLGGNLSSLVSLLGTPWFPDLKNKLLFLEDVGEPFYKIDRMFYQLAYAEKLKDIKGLVLGNFGEINPERLKSLVKEVFPTIPIIGAFPAGHTPLNYPFFIGLIAKIEAQTPKGFLFQENPIYQKKLFYKF